MFLLQNVFLQILWFDVFLGIFFSKLIGIFRMNILYFHSWMIIYLSYLILNFLQHYILHGQILYFLWINSLSILNPRMLFDNLENFHFLYNVEKLNNATRCIYWASYERGQIRDRVAVSAQQKAQIGRHGCWN